MTRDPLKKFTLHAKKALREAAEISVYCGAPHINPEHLLFSIHMEKGSLGNNLLENMGIKKDFFNSVIQKSIPLKIQGKTNAKNDYAKISRDLKSILLRACQIAGSHNCPYVGTEHLIYALMESGDAKIKTILQHAKTNPQAAKSILSSNIPRDAFPNLSKIFNLPDFSVAKRKKGSGKNTPFLNQFCLNVNEDVKKRKELTIGRKKEIARIADILGRKNKNNPVLVGDPGVGKTAIVNGLAEKINAGEVSANLLSKKIMLLDMALVVAGTSYRGEFETRLKEIIREATQNKNIILFIDEIHGIVGAGNASGGMDAANILKPALSRGDIQCIGATTITEYKKYIEKDPALERRLQPIKVEEPSLAETREILNGIKESYEKFHNIIIYPDAIENALILSDRYIQDRFFPDKALDLIDEAASFARNQVQLSNLGREIKKLEQEYQKSLRDKNILLAKENYEEAVAMREREKTIQQELKVLTEQQKKIEKENPTTLSGADIIATVAKITGIPIEQLSSEPGIKIKNIEKKLNSRVIGQTEAVQKIAGAILRSQSGIASPERPLGSFLFLGPTGVGKTLTAKILAEEFFENSKALIRIDMSEFMERHNVSQLLGAPAGYIGYGEGGKLTEKVRRNPHSLILFDEIEKAHPDIFNILLQLLEEGALTDAEGRLVNFKNTLIILTSNIGTQEFTASAKIGFDSGQNKKNQLADFTETKTRVLTELKKQIKPELLNRLDNIIVFNPLGKKEIAKIAALELEKLARRLQEKNLRLACAPQVIDYLAAKSFSIDNGARLVRKNIRELVEDPLANLIMTEKVRNHKISVKVEKGEIKII